MEQTFLKKINKASSAEASNHKKVRLIILILTIAGTLFALTEYDADKLYNAERNRRATLAYFESYFGMFLVFVAAYFGMFAVFGIFKDMVNKQTADVQMSLPMSAKERYCSKLLALVKLHLLPLLGSGVVMVLGGAVKVGFGGTAFLLRIYTVLFAQAFFADAVSIFCMCCCGALAEGVYTSLITMVCLSATPYGTFEAMISAFSGLRTYATSAMEVFSLTGILSMQWLPGMHEPGTDGVAYAYLFANILISCLLIAVTFLIYRKRDARSVGKPFVYELFMEIFMFIGLFTLYLIFFATNTISAGIVTAFIVYFVIRIVAARAKINVKVFMIWTAKFAASMAVFYLIAGIAYFTGGFGFYKYFPDMSDMNGANIYIHTHYYDGDAEYFYYRDYDHWFTSYSDNKFDAQKNGNNIHSIVKKYNTIDDRTLTDFFESMSYRGVRSHYWKTKIEVQIDKPMKRIDEMGYEYEYTTELYNLTIYIPDEKYDEAVSDIRQYFTED